MDWEKVKEQGFWWVLGLGFLALIIIDPGSGTSSGSHYDPYDDYDEYVDQEPDFYDYAEYIDADSVEACSSSGCYDLDADVENGIVHTIYFPNGGYVELDAVIDSDGNAAGSDSDGDDWEIQVDQSEIDEAREEYLEARAESEYDPGDDDYYP